MIDENLFIKLASLKWADVSLEKKAEFQVQWNDEASSDQVDFDQGLNRIKSIYFHVISDIF